MKREEAINLIGWLKSKTNRDDDLEAIDMAIEALSAEAVHKPDYSYEADMVKRLRQAEAVQGWIPVEEQPPLFPCLVCDANGNQPSVPLGIVTITDEEHGEWHIDGRLWDSPHVFVEGEWGSQLGYGNRIIAWMPLPKPYKVESEE